MEVKILKDEKAVGVAAAQEFIKLLKVKPNATLGLATGSSPIETYKELIKANKAGEISFKDVKTFNLDEYSGIEQTHPQSFYTFMKDNLFKDVDYTRSNLYIPSGMGNLEKNCQEYHELLNANPRDLQILGIGGNGHIAFNEPGTSFEQTTHVINLTEQTIKDNSRFFQDKSEVPTQAITMGLKEIMDAKEIILIATGEGKAQAIKEMIEGEITENLPASILQKHDNVLVLIDEKAAKHLNR